MKTITAPVLIGEISGFVTAQEIECAHELETELNRLKKHADSVNIPFADKRAEELADAYATDPSDIAFNAFKFAAREAALLEKIIPAKVLAVTEGAVNRFIEETLLPWTRAILNRGLAEARLAHDEVTNSESKRHEALTGREMTHSGVVEASKAAVSELEKMTSETSPPRIFDYLRAHQQKTITILEKEDFDAVTVR